jgi:PBP superfamily domain
MKVKTIGRAVVVSIATAVAVAAAATPAVADPPAGQFRQLAGVGSDTTQDLMNALGATIGGGSVVASYDARPPAGGSTTIKTKATNCEFLRPNGSGNGRRALRASENEDIGGGPGVWPGDATGVNVVGCVDFARSSSYGGTTPQSTGNYTYIPAGVDAVTLGVHEDGDLPLNWSFAQIQRVYKCFDTTVAGNPVVPRMIQAGSGTWEFWLQPQRMAITENEIALGDYPCMAPNGTPLFPRVQEHDGSVLTGNLTHVIPFSAAQFVAQTNKTTIETAIPGVTIADRLGPVHVAGVSTTTQTTTQPVVGGVLNINFPVPLRRDVYNVVPTADLGNATIASTFVGTSSAVCSQAVTVGGQQRRVTELLGFGIRTTFNNPLEANCGYTDLRFNS